MARVDRLRGSRPAPPEHAVRAPAVLRLPHEAGDDDDGRPRLRLVVTKGTLGVELQQPVVVGAIAVAQLALSFPDARFPVDLSGGIGAFRHRRGELEHLEIELSVSGQPWGAQLTGLFDANEKPDIVIAPVNGGLQVGARGKTAALAFEVIIAPADDDVRLIPIAARGLGLAAPPQAMAAAMVAKVASPLGSRIGTTVVIERVSRAVCRALLPLAGMRVPASERMRWSAPEPLLGAARLCASSQQIPEPPLERTVRAVELAALSADAEEALGRGELDEARRRYLAALERAPRHPELVARLAEIDRTLGNHHAALGMLADLGPAVDAGALAGELLARAGDSEGARAAFRRAAEQEPYGSLAALCWLKIAELADDHDSAVAAIDRAVACAPSWIELRWRRFEARLAAADVKRALFDAAELEVSARGSSAKHRTAARVAEALLSRRHLDEAATWFERALRYRPDSAGAVAGLARSLGMLGHRRRALELHGRAYALASRSGSPAAVHRLALDLARALVEIADDRPAAIALVRSIPALVPEAFEARICEARWRAELGDVCGASETLARLGDEVEHALGALVGPHDPAHLAGEPVLDAGDGGFGSGFASRRDAATAIAAFLEEGARIEEIDRGDRLAARRLLSLALRLDPRRRAVQAAFRRVAEPAPPSAPPRAPAPGTEAPRPAQPAEPLIVEPVVEEVDDELLAERLTDKLRANPSDAAVVMLLADVLERLGRNHDLLALLSARIEEEGEPLRSQLLPRRRAVLSRLRDDAAAQGRSGEIDLYELMLSRE